MSLDYLLLRVATPELLAAHHTTVAQFAKQAAYPCTGSQIRELHSSVGEREYFCAASNHAPDGGWIQSGRLYLLEVGTPAVDYGTTAARVDEFQRVAKAISSNVGR